MTMNIVQLVTYLDADQAETVIDFLDQLREVLLNHYGDRIARQHRIGRQLAQQQVDFIDGDLF